MKYFSLNNVGANLIVYYGACCYSNTNQKKPLSINLFSEIKHNELHTENAFHSTFNGTKSENG